MLTFLFSRLFNGIDHRPFRSWLFVFEMGAFKEFLLLHYNSWVQIKRLNRKFLVKDGYVVGFCNFPAKIFNLQVE